jgi:hypothetical protein
VVRTQIQITRQQARKLRVIAKRSGLSLAEVIRRCIDQALEGGLLDRKAMYDRAAEGIGAFADPEASDLAEGHDRYLDDAFRR